MSSESASSPRKLAAILFADIQGYTAMMQSDEGTAMHRLRHYQSVLKQEVGKYSGEIIKNYGDGSLCLFTSVLDAVMCAKTLQEVFRSEPIVPLRIGLHLGDVMYEENDIYGNALNIASRIESMGVAGGVLISNDIYKKVKNQSNLRFLPLGSFEFKNVDEPMEIYAMANPGMAVPKANEMKGKLAPKSAFSSNWKIPAFIGMALIMGLIYWFGIRENEQPVDQDSPTIAILPFEDMSPDKDQEYFADGMMEEILNHLVKIEGLQVTSRTSSMTYKGQKKKASLIAKELGVASVLEGSVRKAGDELRISVQFIDGETDKQIWSESYDGNLENVFAMQSNIARLVANQLRAQITPEVITRMEQAPTENMEAYSLYLKARKSRNENDTRLLLLEAIRLDSSFAEAYIDLGRSKLYQIIFTRDTIPENVTNYLGEVNALLDKGLSLNPNNADAYIHKGAMSVWFDWDFEKAKSYYEKALALNPSSDYIAYTELLLALGDLKGALNNSTLTINANQNNAYAWVQQAIIHNFLNEPQKSEEALSIAKNASKYVQLDGNYLRLLVFQQKYAEMLSNYEKIPEADLYPRLLGYAAISYFHTGQLEKVNPILELLKEQSDESSIGSPAFHIAMIYAQMGNVEEAFEWLETAFQNREIEMYWLKVEPPFQPLYDDSRWREMLFKVGFTVDVKG